MARTVAADHGYDRTEAAGRLVLRVRRQDSIQKFARWLLLFLLVGFSLYTATLMDDHFHWRTTYAWKTGAVGVVIILLYGLMSGKPKYTTIDMGHDDLTVAGKTFAKRDIRNVVVQGPDGQVLWAPTALGLQAKMDLARLAATQQYAVDFDYGLNKVRVVGQLTAPQAERVGTEVATWLAA